MVILSEKVWSVIKSRISIDSESYEILTESAKKGASIDHPASKVDVDPEKAVLACFAGENGTLRWWRDATCSNVPAGHVGQEETADEGEDKLGQPHQDEHGVAAAEVEPVATQQTKPNAGMGLLLDQNAKDKIFWDLIQVAMSWDFPLAVQSPSSESTKGESQMQKIGPKSPSGGGVVLDEMKEFYFLAVQNSSIGDLVRPLLGWLVCYH